jgi:membrane protease YdiL (CAAX protease family)
MQSLKNQVDLKRVLIFCGFAFGMAWAAALAIYLTGGLNNRQAVIILVSVGYMGAPAVSHVVTRFITREGWQNLYLRTNFKQGWKYWLLCWLLPGFFTLAGALLFFVIFPQHFDSSLGVVKNFMKFSLPGKIISDELVRNMVIGQTALAMLVAPLLNALPVFGEEFGWRAYLLPKLMPLGWRKAMLAMGVIWGLWHAPLIAMGHNFGLDYSGAPWLGMLVMIWFCLVFGTIIGWASLQAGSVWPAVIGHGAINGIAGISVLLIKGEPNALLGPIPVGLIGSFGFTLISLWLFWKGGGKDSTQAVSDQPLA